MEGSSRDQDQKKSPFDNLSRDDLIKKCKNLLMIAQKAKQAKDESLEEIRLLKESVSQHEIQKNADKESLKAMQEIVEKLTSDKLVVANEAESFKRKLIKLEKDTKELDKKLLVENEALKLQLNKLIEENKGLISDLASLEKKYVKEVSGDLKGQLEFLQNEAVTKNDEIKALNEKIATLEKEKREFTSKNEQSDFEIEEKLALLEDEVQEKTATVASQASQIEALQNEVDRLKSPDEAVEKLKAEIFVLTEKVILLENENASDAEILQELKDAKEALEVECSNLRAEARGLSEVEDLRAELAKHKEMLKDLQNQLSDCHESKTAKMKQCEELESLTKEFEKMKNEKDEENQRLQRRAEETEDVLKARDGRIKELENLQVKVEALEKEAEEAKKKLSSLEEVNSEFERQIEHKNGELEDNRQRLATLEGNGTWYEKQFDKLRAENEALKAEAQKGAEKTDEKDEISALKAQMEESRGKIEGLLKEKEDLEAKLSSLRDVNEQFERELEHKNGELEDNRQRLATLEGNGAWYEEQFSKLRSEAETLKKELKQTKEDLEKCLQNTEKASKEEVESLKSALKESQETVKNLESQLERKQEEASRVASELEEAMSRNKLEKNQESEQINELNRELESLRLEKEAETDNLRIDLQTVTEERDRLVGEKGALETQLLEEAKVFNKEIQELREIARIDTENQVSEIRELKTKMEELREKHHEEKRGLETALEELNLKLTTFKTENSELLSELKEINEAFRKRGEVINLQVAKISDLERAGEAQKVQLEQLGAENEALQRSVKELETPKPDMSDALSTSTISRMEESQRMRDFEDSYEEKYNKLRGLAVKLKKKVTEQQALLIKFETGQSAQLIQKENDVLKEQLEEQKKKIADLESEDKGQAVKVKSAEGDAIREYQSQIKSLKMEKEAFNVAKRELDKQIETLKANVEKKDAEISQIKESQEKLQAELTKAKAAVKKTNVLSLEMDAYEKSLNDLNSRLEAKKQQVVDLEATIATQNGAIDSCKDQIRILEESLEAEKSHSKELKQQMDSQQLKNRESEHEKAELKVKVDDLVKQLEQVKLESDENRLHLAELATGKEKILSSLEAEKAKYLKSSFILEEKVETLTRDLKNRETELEDMRTEFASYKVRAQSVLRQNQTKESGREKELEEELLVVREDLQREQEKIQAASAQKAEFERQIGELVEEKQRIQSRCKDLLSLLEEVRVQGETFAEETQRKIQEKEEQLKTQRLQNETLRLCYEKQIQELLEKQNLEVERLKSKMASSPPREQEPSEEPALYFGASNGTSTDEQKISMILAQREEGEGSESTSNYHPFRKSSRGHRDLIPLDELLSSPFEEHPFEERSISPTVELQQTRDKLVVQETRVKHLTSLLAEAEQDLGKLTQLNEVLKEEVRRTQRSVEREQHLHNSEYLKNVILKFLTLSSGDERGRLVPVLNTMLKLSPEETQKLQTAAKGGEGLTGRLTGMLPLWSNNNNN